MDKIPAKTIVTKNKNTFWFGCDYTMNLYRGCSHGCIYCDSRSRCYGITEFAQVREKENALQIVRDDLRRKVKKGMVGSGAMSDPYNPKEETLQLTRHSLELLDAYQFGVSMLTKSDLILRDKTLYGLIAEHSPVNCMLTVTTADHKLAKKIEPGAPSPERRFAVVRELRNAGIFSGIVMTPILPYLEDTRENVLRMVELAKESGANFLYPMFGVTLRDNQRAYYYKMLDQLFPESELSKRYQKRYGERYNCHCPNAGRLYKLLGEECEKAGILYRMPDIVHACRKNYQYEQLSLF